MTMKKKRKILIPITNSTPKAHPMPLLFFPSPATRRRWNTPPTRHSLTQLLFNFQDRPRLSTDLIEAGVPFTSALWTMSG
jgi:hypothetical protein